MRQSFQGSGVKHDTYRCPRCARYEGRLARNGRGMCDWCHMTFSATEELLAPPEKENK